MKVTVYTCVAGGYDDRLPIIKHRDPSFHYEYFTDNNTLKSDIWMVRELRSPKSIAKNHYINRYHKLYSKQILENTDVSVYIDGNIDIHKSIQPLIDEFINSDALFGCLKHPQRSTLQEEAEACIRWDKLKTRELFTLKKQLEYYRIDGYPEDYPLFAATILFKKHCKDKRLNAAMSLWWEHINKFAHRDQLALPYVLWKTKLPYMAFDFNIFDNEVFKMQLHSKKYRRNVHIKNFRVWNKKIIYNLIN